MHFYLIRPLKMTFIGVTQGSQTTKDTLQVISLNPAHKSIFTTYFWYDLLMLAWSSHKDC